MENQVCVNQIQIILPARKSSKTGGPSWESYSLIPINRDQRPFWPAYRVDFMLQTDVANIVTRVVGGSGKAGEAHIGSYITRNMNAWFRAHPELQVGSVLEATKLEDLLYQLQILQV